LLNDDSYKYDVNIYGMSQNPDTKIYILVFSNEYFDYYCKKCGNKYEDEYDKWCKPCQINQLKNDFTNWTSGNEKIDDFIQKKQLEFKNNKLIFGWIPYNKFIDVEEIGNNCLAKAIWRDGPLYPGKIRFKRESYKKVYLKYLHHDSQDITDEFLNKVLEFSINLDVIILI
jgi:hypothetical protein